MIAGFVHLVWKVIWNAVVVLVMFWVDFYWVQSQSAYGCGRRAERDDVY